MKKICVVTGSRAEYGLLKSLLTEIIKNNNLQLQLIVTGMHTSEKFGLTRDLIIADGFEIDFQIDMKFEKDNPLSITTDMGYEMVGFAKAFDVLKPDTLLVLGDRYEILVATCVSTIYGIQVVHLCGGDITEGAYDDNIRHAITKMSHIHLATNKVSAKRIIQMGEHPDRVYIVGNPGLWDIINLKEDRDIQSKFKMNEKNIIVIYHPETMLSNNINQQNIVNILMALSKLIDKNMNIYFIGTNSDNDNIIISEEIINFINSHENCYMYTSLDRNCYLNLLKCCDLIIGNSSSGIYEAPLLNTPTINIGNRQTGRFKARSVIDCEAIVDDIISGIISGFKFSGDIEYAYPIENSCEKIIKILENIDNISESKKKFYDISW